MASLSTSCVEARPLSGVRVADFTWIGAGSFTTKLLADMGASVVKIESGKKLDSLRISPPFKDGQRGVNRSGYFADRNSSKKSITLNLKTTRGVELARDIIRQSDIVANNFSPGVMKRIGLGYEAVREINPSIIYIEMSVNGADGPEADMIGYGVTIGAMSGLQFLSGDPKREPTGSGTHFPDHIPNPTHAAFAVLAALRHRRRTGRGQSIDLAQTEPMIALLGSAMIEAALPGRAPFREGNRKSGVAPRGVYPAAGADRWIAIAVTSDAAWRQVVEFLGVQVDRPEWRSAAVRERDHDAIDEALSLLTSNREGEELMAALLARGVAAGVVRSPAELVDADPQLAHRQHWRRLNHPEMGLALYNNQPFRFSSADVGPRAPAPLLGQHTEELCGDLLGLSPAEIAQLREEGVLA